jgi:cytoplasmic iron level regulating protein YaaA (DUF328/UPF0246 family)
VLILLPPSEGKSPAPSGKPVELASLNFPELTAARTSAMAALATVSGRPDALSVLKVGASLGDEVQRNTILDTAPAAPAHNIYSGVLYDALDYGSMTPSQRQRAEDHIVIVSALWGAIRFGDRIPAYRLSMSVDLPGAGKLAPFWKRHLEEPLRRHSEGSLVVDCRSSSYASAWTAPAGRTVSVNVLKEAGGRRTVVSHFAKHTRGELVRHLVTRRGKAPSTAAELLAAASERWRAELAEGSGRRCARLNIILPGN